MRARIHQLLRDRLFQVPSAAIPQMPLFAISDIPLYLFFHRAAFRTIRYFHRYRSNLKLREWRGIHTIYPRSHMLYYLYEIFLWARYCGVLDEALKQPDKTTVGEVFIRYICQMDEYLDSFDSQALRQQDIRRILRLKEARNLSHELSHHLQLLEIPPDTYSHILKIIVRYRRGYLQALGHPEAVQPRSLEAIIHDKELVAGELMGAWTDILSCLYGVPDALSAEIRDVFCRVSMVIQFFDDLGDVPEDYAVHADNLFLAIAQNHQEEWARLAAFLKQQTEAFLDWPWVVDHMPSTHADFITAYQSYLSPLIHPPYQTEVTREFYTLIEAARQIGSQATMQVAVVQQSAQELARE
ncbi:MAG: hypothetical protein H6672_12715 [Anaerolineaceae bacterium]|nr:hypothetical protein [Anaerolineaceae bacterium]